MGKWKWGARPWLVAIAMVALLVALAPAFAVSHARQPAPPIATLGLPTVAALSPATAVPTATMPALVGQQYIYVPPTPTPQLRPEHFATVAYFGDSLTGGFYATNQARDYVSIVTAAIGAQETAFEGTYGHSAAMSYASMQSSPPPSAALDIVELGTNDTEATSTFSQDYQGILAILRKVNPQARILCLGPWQDNEPLRVADDQAVQADCQAAGGTFIDLMPLFANPANRGPAGRSTWLGAADNFHPNDGGHAAIAQAILMALSS